MNLLIVFIVWIVFGGIVLIKFKERIIRYFTFLESTPSFLGYLILSIPVILLEESLTCETPYLSCITVTLPAFLIMFSILYLIQRSFKLNWSKTSLLFGLLGWVNEFIFVGRLFHSTFPIFIWVTLGIENILIYSVMAILPAYYLSKKINLLP